MKRHLSLIAVMVLSCTMAMAQKPTRKLGLFNHLSAGIEVGTTGFGAELATPLTKFLSLRAGFTMVPTISHSFDINYESSKGNDRTIDLKAKLHMMDWKVLADLYPIPSSSFHLTGGFYIGKPKPITAQNKTPLAIGYGPDDDLEPGEGLEIGDYLVTPDANGIIRANAKVAKFKPYVGLGFGRPVAKQKKLVTCAFDLGVQFWNTPTLNAYSPNDNLWVKVSKEDIDDKDFQDAYKIVNKLKVYPVLNFRLYFNAL